MQTRRPASQDAENQPAAVQARSNGGSGHNTATVIEPCRLHNPRTNNHTQHPCKPRINRYTAGTIEPTFMQKTTRIIDNRFTNKGSHLENLSKQARVDKSMLAPTGYSTLRPSQRTVGSDRSDSVQATAITLSHQ